MKITPKKMKWMLRFYPPFFFQRIWVVRVYDNFIGAEVKINKSILNANTNNSIFGGTIFSSIDPIHPLLLNGYFRSNGISKTVVWLKSAKICYIKPARSNLYISIKLEESEIKSALKEIRQSGKITRNFASEIKDRNGDVCAICDNEIYIRDLKFDMNK